MKKRRVYKTPASKSSGKRSIAASTVPRNEQPAHEETEHPVLTLQRQLGNSRVARLVGAARAGREEKGPIQLQPKGPSPSDKSKKGEQSPASRPETELWVLTDMLTYHTDRLASGMPSFEKLYMAMEGKDLNKKPLPDRDRRELFDEAILELKHVIAFAPEWQKAALRTQRDSLFRAEARDRADSALTIGKKVVELPGDLHPREQAGVFRQYLPTLRETIQTANEQVLRLGEDKLEQALEHIAEHGAGKAGILGKLAALNGVLGLADGWLTLTDEELPKELANINAALSGLEKFSMVITTFSDLLKAIVEVGMGAVSMVASLAAGIAKLSGDVALTESAMGVAAKAGHVLGTVVAGIEIVHGIFVLLNPRSTSQEKEKAVFGWASGTAFLVGGGPASLGVLVTYIGAKVAAQAYFETANAVTGYFMNPMWEFMQGTGSAIAQDSKLVANANVLLLTEKDPTKAKYLADLSTQSSANLAISIDWFLQHTLSAGADMKFGGEMALESPGATPVLAEAFAPLQHFRKVKSGPALLEGATQILNMIVWCMKHRDAVEQSGMRGKNLVDIIDDDTKAAQKGKAKD